MGSRSQKTGRTKLSWGRDGRRLLLAWPNVPHLNAKQASQLASKRRSAPSSMRQAGAAARRQDKERPQQLAAAQKKKRRRPSAFMFS